MPVVSIGGSEKAEQLSVAGSDIAELKVTDIPRELKLRSSKKKNKSKQQQVDTPKQPALQDDAILFYEDGSSGTPSKNGAGSKATPKSKLVYSSNNHNNDSSGSRDIQWGNDIEQIKKSKDFDFEGSTAKFDKGVALEEFEVSDNVDPSQRLAGHNKKAAKTKFDHDENVIEKKLDSWNNENVSGSLALKQILKVGGAVSPSPVLANTARAESPGLARRSPSLDVRGFQLLETETADSLPLCSPIQLLEILRISTEQFKITPQIIMENASRSISGLIIKILGGKSRVSSANHNLPPLVLILAGNNRTGARALATGRQLINQGCRVLVFTLIDLKSNSVNSDEFLDENFKQQFELFKLHGGKFTSSLSELNGLITNYESPIELCVDALQGFDTNLNESWGVELENVKKIIPWCNSQQFGILSFDIPSGVDAGSGLIGELEIVEAKYVVSLGLPVNGILHAYSNGVVAKGDWDHYLVDIGLPMSKLFKKGSLRKFDRKWFCGQWCLKLEVSGN